MRRCSSLIGRPAARARPASSSRSRLCGSFASAAASSASEAIRALSKRVGASLCRSPVVERFLRVLLVVEQRLTVEQFARAGRHSAVAVAHPAVERLLEPLALAGVLRLQRVEVEVLVGPGHEFLERRLAVARQAEGLEVADLLRRRARREPARQHPRHKCLHIPSSRSAMNPRPRRDPRRHSSIIRLPRRESSRNFGCRGGSRIESVGVHEDAGFWFLDTGCPAGRSLVLVVVLVLEAKGSRATAEIAEIAKSRPRTGVAEPWIAERFRR